jgi:hypothetical protein
MGCKEPVDQLGQVVLLNRTAGRLSRQTYVLGFACYKLSSLILATPYLPRTLSARSPHIVKATMGVHA